MKSPIDLLSEIRSVEAPDYLYTNIMARIGQKQLATISVGWVKAAAAILIAGIGIETAIVLRSPVKDKTSSSESLIYELSNNLYDE